jgi:hypothetical protein
MTRRWIDRTVAVAGLVVLGSTGLGFAQPPSGLPPVLPAPTERPPASGLPAQAPPAPATEFYGQYEYQEQKPPVVFQTPQPAQPFYQKGDYPRPQGYHVVLLLGNLQAGSGQDTLPASARKALDDMKDFLPYKSYRVLDSAWTLSTGNIVNRLRGPEDKEYELDLRTSPMPDRISVRFMLREAGIGTALETVVAESARDDNAALRRELTRQLSEAESDRRKMRSAGTSTEKVDERIAQLRLQLAAQEPARRAPATTWIHGPGRIIDTSFTMDVGETVVVGTSRLKGDEALIVLLSAVPRSKGGVR